MLLASVHRLGLIHLVGIWKLYISQRKDMHVGVTPQDYKNRHDPRLAESWGCKTVPWWLG